MKRICGARLKLYPKPAQAERFARWMREGALLHDILLRHAKLYFREHGKSMNRAAMLDVVYGYARKYPGDWLAITRNQIAYDLERSYNNFFRNPGHYEKPRPKHGGEVSVYVHNQTLKVSGNYVRLASAKYGWTRYRGTMPDARILSGRIRRDAGGWWLSLQVEAEPLATVEPVREKCGVDAGINTLAVVFDGQGFTKHENSRELRRDEKRVARIQRGISRSMWRCTVCDTQLSDADRSTAKRTKKRKAPCGHWIGQLEKSRRMRRAKQRLARIHRRIRNRRKNRIHHASADIVRRHGQINIEDLNVKGMQRSRIAKSVSDASMGELRRQLTYKADWHGRTIKVSDRFFPSSKTCSSCGWYNADFKRETIFECPECGHRENRDMNAARNIYDDERWKVPPRRRKPASPEANGRGDSG